MSSSASKYSLQVICCGARSCWCSCEAHTGEWDWNPHIELGFLHMLILTTRWGRGTIIIHTIRMNLWLTLFQSRSLPVPPHCRQMAASHSQTAPRQTDTKEDKGSWFTGKLLCTIMNEWVCNSGTETGILPAKAAESFHFIQRWDYYFIFFPQISLCEVLSCSVFWLCLVAFETGPWYVDLKFVGVFLPLPLKCWDATSLASALQFYIPFQLWL